MNQGLRKKFVGGLFGTALGDAIGELAFRNRFTSSLLNVIQQRSALQYTDDTTMAIGLAEALLSYDGKLLPQKIGEIFHRHYKQNPSRGYGRGPSTIFRTVEKTGKSYVEIAQTLFNGEGSFGNGAAMRITPVALYFYDSDNNYKYAEKSAIVTHAHRLGIEGAALLAKLISIVVEKSPNKKDIKEEKTTILDTLFEITKTSEYKDKLTKVKSLLQKEKSLDVAADVLGSGEKVTALDSVPFVVFAFFHNPYTFQHPLLNTVIQSGDADTIGAMLGGVLGSYHGFNTIPKNWIEKIENKQDIKRLAIKLATLKTSKA